MPTPSYRGVLSLFLIVGMGISPATLAAQQATQPAAVDVPSVTIRANTRLVLVDVIVTDKKGQPVTGLKADDFTLEESGKKQKVTVFVPPAANRPNPSPALPGILSNHPESVGPSGIPIVLLLDAVNSPFKDQAYGRSQMLKYAAEQIQGGHPMAILALTDRLHVLQEFTTDPQVLATAIKNYKPQEQMMQTKLEPAPTALSPDMAGPGGNVASKVIAAQAALADFAAAQVAFDEERRTLITLDAMQSLARMLGGLQGRKNVVWLTASLPFDLIPEDRNMSEAEYLADLPSGTMRKSGALRGAGAIAEEERSLHGNDIRMAEAQLAASNIAIYPVDLRGLVGAGMDTSSSFAHDTDIHGAGLVNQAISQSGSVQASQGTMEEVAAETGGKPYMNQNEIKNGIALATDDDKASYEIGYYPENRKWDGKYRNIKVKLAQGDTQLRYRKGYYAVDTTAGKNTNYERDVVAALQLNAPVTQIYFMAQAKPGDPGKVRVVFLVDAHTVTAEDSGGDKKLNVSLYACVFDKSGKNLTSQSTKVDRAFDAATYHQILDKGMMVPIDLNVPPGGTELRLAVLDNKTGYIGTVSGPLGQ